MDGRGMTGNFNGARLNAFVNAWTPETLIAYAAGGPVPADSTVKPDPRQVLWLEQKPNEVRRFH